MMHTLHIWVWMVSEIELKQTEKLLSAPPSECMVVIVAMDSEVILINIRM